jgi:hypothetical protein
VFAVTVPWEFGRVDMIQFVSQADVVDLPIPWPLEIAWRIGSTAFNPSNFRFCTSRPMSLSSSRCHSSGPPYCSRGLFGVPQG